jgi:hypothetical protein
MGNHYEEDGEVYGSREREDSSPHTSIKPQMTVEDISNTIWFSLVGSFPEGIHTPRVVVTKETLAQHIRAVITPKVVGVTSPPPPVPDTLARAFLEDNIFLTKDLGALVKHAYEQGWNAGKNQKVEK